MIVDVILDRKDDEAEMAQGYTHKQYFNGDIVPLAYDPHKFYVRMMEYEADDITRAMDSRTEDDVKKALCDYITRNDYNPAICDYIRSRNWLE